MPNQPAHARNIVLGLHRLTWLAALLVATALVLQNTAGQLDRNPYTGGASDFNHGWPMIYMSRLSTVGYLVFPPKAGRWPIDRGIGEKSFSFEPRYLAADVALALALVVGTIFSFEHWARRRGRWYQWSVGSLFRLVFVAAALMAIHRTFLIRIPNGDFGAANTFSSSHTLLLHADQRPKMWSGDSWWEYFPMALIGLGLGCAINSVLLAAVQLIRLTWRRLAPSPAIRE
ncbi:MAG: hypothetical protein K8T25_19700 [Planctomycetia bacterium]|nr:hypothetical protein [Planctomycetia bacterium]